MVTEKTTYGIYIMHTSENFGQYALNFKKRQICTHICIDYLFFPENLFGQTLNSLNNIS